MNVSKRKIQMFRCYYDPMIGGKAKQAFSMTDNPNWHMELTPIGVYVKCPIKNGATIVFHSHLVPFNNVQSIKFTDDEGEDESTVKQKTA